MRVATKKLITQTINNEIKRLKSAVEHSETNPRSPAMIVHINKLKQKIWKLTESLEELEFA